MLSCQGTRLNGALGGRCARLAEPGLALSFAHSHIYTPTAQDNCCLLCGPGFSATAKVLEKQKEKQNALVLRLVTSSHVTQHHRGDRVYLNGQDNCRPHLGKHGSSKGALLHPGCLLLHVMRGEACCYGPVSWRARESGAPGSMEGDLPGASLWPASPWLLWKGLSGCLAHSHPSLPPRPCPVGQPFVGEWDVSGVLQASSPGPVQSPAG